ncbi:unnamed protein product [Orchesella dallaii]|uniref:Nicotinamide riboside kinase 1 n=1 Tax=Orchesella dallaii TaxID=48710 RepID=A0ABP1Q361_9HEXA
MQALVNILPHPQPKRLVVGISGATCGGKTTISKLLKETFPWANVIYQDAYFHPNDPKYHVYLPEIEYFNWELDTAVDFERMEQDVNDVLLGKMQETNDSPFFQNSKFVSAYLPEESEVKKYAYLFSHIQLTILEGHIIFNRSSLNSICDLKFFLTLDENECWSRRQERIYKPQPPPQFFETCVWPSYARRWEEVKKLQRVTFIDAKETPLENIYQDIKASVVSALMKL